MSDGTDDRSETTGEGAFSPIGNRKSKIENRPTPDLTIAIMAGGRSRRMGRDKAMIPVGGVPMLERVARAALGAGLPVIVVGRQPPDGWPLDAVSFHPDHYPDTGPLGGLATALEVSGTSVLLLACDMPLITTEAIRWLIGQWDGSGEGVVAMNEGRMEPLFAVYGALLLPHIVSLSATREYSMNLLIGKKRRGFTKVDLPLPVREGVVNVNSEEDLDGLGCQ